MADKKIIKPFEALKCVAEHLSTFYYLYNLDEKYESELVRIVGAIGGTVCSHSNPQPSVVEFKGQKEAWEFMAEYMEAFMELKKLADDGHIQYSEHKDGYGFPLFEVSVSSMRYMKRSEQAAKRCRKAKLSETLEAKVHEVIDQVFFGEGKVG